MSAHDHRVRVAGCFRCELSADEVALAVETVTVDEMGGVFEGGPDSVEWLRRQRERDTDA
jgi:hypothetical protein